MKGLDLVVWDFFCNFAPELRKLAAPQHNSNKFDSASVCTIIAVKLRKLAAPQHNSNKFDSASVCTIIALEFVRDDNLVSQVCIFLVLKVLIF